MFIILKPFFSIFEIRLHSFKDTGQDKNNNVWWRGQRSCSLMSSDFFLSDFILKLLKENAQNQLETQSTHAWSDKNADSTWTGVHVS